MNLAAKPPATLSAADRSHAMADIKAKGFEEFTAFALLRDHNGDVVKAKQAADDSLHLESLGLTRGDAIRLLKKHKWNRRAAVAEREAINKAAEKALQDKARQKAIIRVRPDSVCQIAMAESNTRLATMLPALAIWRNS